MGYNCGDFKTFQILKILILRIFLGNYKILRKILRMLVNMGPGLLEWEPWRKIYSAPVYGSNNYKSKLIRLHVNGA